MITPAQLFFRRVRAEWRFQYGVWKTAIDWTVALYIVIPAALIGLNYYALLWKNQYGWMEGLSFNWLLIAVYIFAWSGWIRTFMEEGDQLFLLRCKGWVKRIVALGLGYSVVLNIFSSFLVFCVCPVIIRPLQTFDSAGYAFFGICYFIQNGYRTGKTAWGTAVSRLEKSLYFQNSHGLHGLYFLKKYSFSPGPTRIASHDLCLAFNFFRVFNQNETRREGKLLL